jgi:hypothetical protein
MTAKSNSASGHLPAFESVQKVSPLSVLSTAKSASVLAMSLRTILQRWPT